MLSLFGAKLGSSVHIYPSVKNLAPWNLEIGGKSGCADGVILYSQGKITLGRRVVVSQGTHLCTGTHNYEVPGFPLRNSPITIDDHAWIAAEVFIHPGIRIGEGSVIGARSVVVKNTPSWTVCACHPCQPLKPRCWRPESYNAA